MQMEQSRQLFARASQLIPGGVNSPARTFNSVGGQPVFIEKARGSQLYDADGNAYTDYVGSWGPMILGHAWPPVVEALQAQASKGTSFGAPCHHEIDLAEAMRALVPALEQIRFVNSGTEATMSAVRLARGYTGRSKIIKFEGCYHGHADHLLVASGSGALTLGTPSSPGVPEDFARHTLTATYNDLQSVKAFFECCPDDIAAVLVEPVAGNMNFIEPVEGFLEGLKQLCHQHGALLIFDEVMTGFRVAAGGAQQLYGVTPDLSTFGKIIGGGLPVGALGGPAPIMQKLSPAGPIYQAGTLAGNPMAMAAGIATLQALRKPDFYEQLTAKTRQLCNGLERAANEAGIDFHTAFQGGMFGMFFTSTTPVTDFAGATTVDKKMFARFFHGMLERGYYFAPSAFECGFMSQAHTAQEIENTINAAAEVFTAIRQ